MYLKFIARIVLGGVFCNVFFAIIYAIFWIIWHKLTNQTIPGSSVEFKSLIDITLMLIATITCGFLFVKNHSMKGVISLVIGIVVVMACIDILAGYFSFKSDQKSDWFIYIYHTSLFLGLLAGNFIQRIRLRKTIGIT